MWGILDKVRNMKTEITKRFEIIKNVPEAGGISLPKTSTNSQQNSQQNSHPACLRGEAGLLGATVSFLSRAA